MLNRLKAGWTKMRRPSLSVLSLIIIIFYVLMTGVVFPLKLRDTTPKTRDTSGVDGYASLMDVYGGREVFKLSGVWEFYPNELYSFDDFTYGRTGTPRLAAFPHIWSAEPDSVIENAAYATYRMRVRVPESFDGIGIYARGSYSAYDVYLNETKICGAGVVSADLSEHVPVFTSANGYTYSASAIGAQGRTFSVIIHVQNTQMHNAGLKGEIYMGSASSIKSMRSMLLVINGLISGGLLLLFICFCVIYLNGRERKEYLDYTIVSLLGLFLSLTMGGEAVLYNVGLSSVLLKRLEYCALIIGAFFANFNVVKSFTNSDRLLNILRVYTTAAVLFFLAAPLMISSLLAVYIIAASSVFFFIPISINLKNTIVKHDFESVTQLLSYTIIFTGVLSAILNRSPWSSVDLFSTSIMIHCVLQMILFLSRYRTTELSLKDMKETLEARINQRTYELTLMKEKAEAATIAKSNFLATMSHEIRTPMNAIMGIADIMRTDNLDKMQQSYLVDIKKSSKALLQIINDILDFSKIEAGKLEINPAHFNLLAMYDNICSMCRFSADVKHIEFRHSFADNVPHYIFGDEIRYRQVIINIINNAVKYTKEGYINFTVRKTELNGEPFLMFIVEDTGIGIKEEDFPKLFDSFEQLDSESNRRIEGTGLGLSITKKLILLMNGTIEIESEYGSGSMFTVLLPLIKGDVDKVGGQETYVPVTAPDARVLVVDDILINITVAVGFLASHGIRPDTAQSGAQAIEMLKNSEYDLVFMDHMMPEMDGVEATRIIREIDGGKYKDLPIIALTANAVTGARDMLKAAGMNDFLSKPIDAEHLNMLLAKWLPKDKVMFHHQERETNTDNRFDEVFAALDAIESFNVRDGISHVANSETAYIALLQQFCTQLDNYIADINRSLSKEDFMTYTIQMHGMKGILATIGAIELSKWAFELETASREKELGVCRNETEGLLQKIRELGESVLAAGVMDALPKKDEPEEILPIEAPKLKEKLNELRSACMLGDIDEAENIMQELEYRSLNQEVDAELIEIFALTRSFDFELVAKRIDKLQDTIG